MDFLEDLSCLVIGGLILLALLILVGCIVLAVVVGMSVG